MSSPSLCAPEERNREALERVFAVVELEVKAARKAIFGNAVRRVLAADPQARFDPVMERMRRIWFDAWPNAERFDVQNP